MRAGPWSGWDPGATPHGAPPSVAATGSAEHVWSPPDVDASGNTNSGTQLLGALDLTVLCKNPAKGVLCEPAHRLSMPYYRDIGARQVIACGRCWAGAPQNPDHQPRLLVPMQTCPWQRSSPALLHMASALRAAKALWCTCGTSCMVTASSRSRACASARTDSSQVSRHSTHVDPGTFVVCLPASDVKQFRRRGSSPSLTHRHRRQSLDVGQACALWSGGCDAPGARPGCSVHFICPHSDHSAGQSQHGAGWNEGPGMMQASTIFWK